MCACIVNQPQNKPTEQQTNNGWGAGSRTYNEYQQGPHQRNGLGNIQQRGRRQQRPMGSGGNELPLGRNLRMAVTQPKGTRVSEGPKFTQRSEPQSTGGFVRALPAIGLSQDKGENKPIKAEQKAASKAVSVEISRQGRKRNIAEEKPEALPATEAPQTVKV